MARDFIIKSKYGGLGDLLFLSHLPRIAKEGGQFDAVYISTLSESRNPAYTDLIWKLNPYVDGFKPDDAPYPEFENVPPDMNVLDRMMLERGLDDGLRFHEPEVYYKPQRLEEFIGKAVYDPNFVSGVGNVSPDELKAYIASQCNLDYQLKPREHSFPIWCGAELLETKSLTHYCDIIFSCARFFCLTSGGATLAAALKRPVTAFYGRGQKAMFHHSNLHKYVEVTPYRPTEPALGARNEPKDAPDISMEVIAFHRELTKSVPAADVKVILDLGSRDAKVAIAFRDLFPTAKVFAFECNPDAIALCKANLQGRNDIGLVEMAVSDNSGTVDFYAIDPLKTVTPHADGNIGASSLFVATADYPMEKYVQRRISVQAITLADWLNNQPFEQIDVIWMDLQGAELKALKGLGEKIHSVKAIYSEVAFQQIYNEQPLVTELETYLLEHGFDQKTILYADAWMGNVLYTKTDSQITPQRISADKSAIHRIAQKPNELVSIAVHCAWKPTAHIPCPELGLELYFSPDKWENFDYALDLDQPFSEQVAAYPAHRRLFATTEPSRLFPYTEDLSRRLAAHYGGLILSWHPQLSKLPQCRPWHAVEKWVSPTETSDEKYFGVAGLISAKNVAGFEGYSLRMKILECQESILTPSLVYNFQQTWRGQPVQYPLSSKDDALKYMFHLSIENCIEAGYFTEKLLDAFVARCVPLYFGDPLIASHFDTRGIIRLNPEHVIEQLNALTEDDYRSRLPYISENFERSKAFWNLDINLAKVISKELQLMEPLKVKNLVTISSSHTPIVAGTLSPDTSQTEVKPDSEFSRAIKDVFSSISPKRIIETGTFLGTGTTHIIARTLRELGSREVSFKTIECNPRNAEQARANLNRAGLGDFVQVINGVTLPRAMLPSITEIEREYIGQKFDEQIFVDHAEQQRAILYHQETEFPNIPDDALGRCMKEFQNRPDFVLLDSAGHLGNLEFNYFVKLLKGPCVIALDDVYHVKHHKSLKQIQSDSRFNILALSREKFGFCIASFSPTPFPRSKEVRQLAWIRSDAIGDNVLAASMLPYIRDHYSKAHITVVCDKRNSNLYTACPCIDDVIEFDRNQLQSDQNSQRLLSERLKSIKFDLCLNSIYSPEPLTDFLVMACQARESVGFRGNFDNMIRESMEHHNRLHTHLVTGFPVNVSELERHRQFLNGIGISNTKPLAPLIWIDAADEAFATSLFEANDLDPSRTIAFFAGAQSEKKQYFNYGKAMKSFCRKHNFSVVALGAQSDSYLNQMNLDDLDCHIVNLSGKTSLRQGAAFIKRCRLAVGADTGLAHVACAVNVPLVVLLGGGHFGRFFPYSSQTSAVSLPLDCYGCGWQCKYHQPHCITGVSVNVLSEAISQTFEKTSDKPRIFVPARSSWPAEGNKPAWAWPQNMITNGAAHVIEVGAGHPDSNENSKESAVDAVPAGENRYQVSICIITNSGLENNLGRRKYIERLLASIAIAGFPAETEVLICGAVGKKYGNAKILEQSEWAAGGKVCALRNAAISAARGKWIIHCDDDILFTTGYWQSVQKHLNDDADILCTRLLNPNGTRYWDWAAFYSGKGQTLLPYDVLDSAVYATGGHAIYRRAIFEKVRWNESILHGGNEEFDFAAQARQNHFKFSLCSQAVVFLQYHHCDAEAVIRQQPQAPDRACSEFLATLGLLGQQVVGSPSMDKLKARVGHKLVPRPTPVPVTSTTNYDISVLVCCHRFLQRFRLFVQSLCAQDYDLSRVELLVSNPHSPDGLSDYLKTLSEACASQNKEGTRALHVKEVLTDATHYRNRGLLVQKAFDNSSGKIVIGMDADVIMPRNFLTEICAALDNAPNSLLGVYRNFLTPETTAKILGGFINPIDQFDHLLSEDVEEPHGYRGVLGYCQAVLREHWAKVGYPTEFDQIDRSDVDFVERLRTVGVSPLFVKNVRLLHLHHPRNWMGTDRFL